MWAHAHDASVANPSPGGSSGRRVARLAVAVGAVAAIASVPNRVMAADEEDCPVVASAVGVQVTTSVADQILLRDPSGVSVPKAYACVNYAIGESTGYASDPYPGETIRSVPGVVQGQLPPGHPSQLDPPPYPPYVGSRYPSAPNPAPVQQPGYELRSMSTGTSSTSHATTGAGQVGVDGAATVASAVSFVNPLTQQVRAAATADVSPVTVGGVLDLGQVHSDATAALGPDGRLTRVSHLTIGHTTVAGQVVEITPAGLSAAGQTAPLPGPGPLDALRAAGVTVTYLAPETTPRGIRSAGLQVTTIEANPQDGSKVVVVLTFGRAYASVSGASGQSNDGSQPGGATGGGTTGPSAGSTSGTVAPVPNLGGATSATTGQDGTGEPPAVAMGPAASSDAGVGVLAGRPSDLGLAGTYLVIAMGALAMCGSGMLLRVLGVRTRWTG